MIQVFTWKTPVGFHDKRQTAVEHLQHNDEQML